MAKKGYDVDILRNVPTNSAGKVLMVIKIEVLLIWANENYNPDAPDTNF